MLPWFFLNPRCVLTAPCLQCCCSHSTSAPKFPSKGHWCCEGLWAGVCLGYFLGSRSLVHVARAPNPEAFMAWWASECEVGSPWLSVFCLIRAKRRAVLFAIPVSTQDTNSSWQGWIGTRWKWLWSERWPVLSQKFRMQIIDNPFLLTSVKSLKHLFYFLHLSWLRIPLCLEARRNWILTSFWGRES